MLIAASIASASAIVLFVLASPRQRWSRASLPTFPMRVSATLAAIVALKGWTEVFDAQAWVFAWATVLLLSALVLPRCATWRRARR